MRTKSLIKCCFAVALLSSLTFPVTAQIVDVGGGLRPGFGRPPLRLNLNPHDATSNYGPYSPTQIRRAYGVDTLLGESVTGSGQTIGIVDAYGDPSIQTDLNNFCNYYGISSTTVTILGTSTRNSGWGLETALDVEWAHAIAPNATIVLSVARSASLTDLLAAVDAAVNAGATVVSMSWGAQESAGINVYDPHFQVPNVTFVASSGDSGELTTTPEVEWPASSPNVVGVGGTTLYLDASGNRIMPGTVLSSETAWSSSGGGISGVYQGVPSWQVGWQNFGWRTVPDVSYVADPNTGVGVAYGRYLYEVGGTSAGAPQWSGLIALANQSLATKVNGNTSIYAVAGTAPAINSANFFDITSGSNGSDTDDAAGTGYDLVTGLGSPVANNLVPALAPQTPGFTVSITPASQTVAPVGVANYTVTVSPSGGFSGAVNLAASGSGSTITLTLPSVTIPSPPAPVSVTLTATTTSTSIGSYTITVTGTSGSLSSSANATLVVATPPDFTLSSPASPITVKRGSSTSFPVTVTALNGFSGKVSFTVTGLPRNATGSFSPTSVTSSGSSTLKISTRNNTPTGTYTLTITGTCSTPALTHSTTVTLTVN